MAWVRTPAWLRPFFPGRVWDMAAPDGEIYLTFDDGPIPEVTPWVLDTLSEAGAKATFFVVGANAERHPDLIARIREEGHAIGNHTHKHVNGWRTPAQAYLQDVERAQAFTSTRLFRPPYGRLTREQSRSLRQRFDVVMWDVLSADFDTRLSGERCARNVIDHTRPGSIIVFHDSLKAEPRLRSALPAALGHFARKGYRCAALPENGIKAAARP